MSRTCSYCRKHAADDTPIGPECGRPSTQVLHWKDGRWSPTCSRHGTRVLDTDAVQLLRSVHHNPRGCRRFKCVCGRLHVWAHNEHPGRELLAHQRIWRCNCGLMHTR